MKKQDYKFGVAHLLIVVIVTFILLVVIGYVVWASLNKSDTKGLSNKASDNSSIETDGASNKADATSNEIQGIDFGISSTASNAAGVISELEVLITDKYSVALDVSVISEAYGGPYYKIPGKVYYISSDSGSLIRISRNNSESNFEKWKTDIIPMISDITEYFTENGYTKSDSVWGSENVYASQNIRCGYDNNNVSPYSLSCADMSGYDRVAQKAEPFIQAYALSGRSIEDVYFNSPSVDETNSNGYQTAHMQTGNAAGLFYRKEGSDWKYFVSTQSVIQCSKYNTDELKAAYKGFTCSDASGKESVVE